MMMMMIDQKLELHAAAMALAESLGREASTLADLRECNGVPRCNGDTRKDLWIFDFVHEGPLRAKSA